MQQHRIQTFKPRRGRYSTQMREGLAHGSARMELDDLAPIDGLFDGAPVILEIGFGLGEATLSQAIAHPEYGIVAIDVHTPGVGRLLAELDARGLTNVRVIEGDALELLHDRLPDASLAGIRVFFPDPWPKARHHKRRIIVPSNLEAMARVLQPGGFLHFATDWQQYADEAHATIEANPHFRILSPQAQPSIASAATRPRTKFEARGIAAGRAITDIVAERC